MVETYTPEEAVEYAIERERMNGIVLGPYHRKWLIEHRIPERVRRDLELAERFPHLVMGRSTFEDSDLGVDFPSAALRAAINTTVTETNLWDPGIFCPLPVGEIRGGKMWVVEFGGTMGTTATPAISFQSRIGTNNSAPPTGTALGTTPLTVTLGTITAPQPFIGKVVVGCRSIGVAASTATMKGNGYVLLPAAAAATVTPVAQIGGTATPTTIDQISAQAIGVSVIWGTSSASNTLTPEWVAFSRAN